jgi:hypothetical protein
MKFVNFAKRCFRRFERVLMRVLIDVYESADELELGAFSRSYAVK